VTKSAGKAIFNSTVIRVSGQLIAWIVTLVTIRLLTPRDYGMVALVMGIHSLFVATSDWSIQQLLLREKTVDKNDEEGLAGLSFLCSVGALTIYGVTGGVLHFVFQQTDLALACALMAPFAIINPCKVVSEARLSLTGQSNAQSFAILVEALGNVFFSWIFVYVFKDFRALIIGSFCGLFLRVLLINLKAGWVTPRFSKTVWEKYKKEYFAVTGGDLLPHLTAMAPNYFVGFFLGNQVLGLLTTAQHIATMPSNKIMAMLNQILLPHFAKLNHDSDAKSFASEIVSSIINLFWFALPIFIGLAIVSKELSLLLFGENWVGIEIYLAAFAIVMPLRIARDFLVNPLRATKNDSAVFKINTISFVGQMIAVVAGIFGGPYVLLICYTIAWAISSLAGIALTTKIFALRWSNSIDLLKPFISILMMILACLLFRSNFTSNSQIALLIGTIFVGGLTYGSIAAFCWRKLWLKN
jgi:O-antigen/teichoic acid export membrane protein